MEGGRRLGEGKLSGGEGRWERERGEEGVVFKWVEWRSKGGRSEKYEWKRK